MRLQLFGEGDRKVPTVRAGDIFRVARQLWVAEGFQGLYAGVSAAWLRQASFGTLRHGLYGLLERRGASDTGQVPLSWRLLSGLVAGSSAAIVANPCDVVLIRMQADGARPLERRRYRHGVLGLRSAQMDSKNLQKEAFLVEDVSIPSSFVAFLRPPRSSAAVGRGLPGALHGCGPHGASCGTDNHGPAGEL